MQDIKVVRVLLSFLLGVTLFIYPIGKIFTNPVTVNQILDKSGFETIITKLFTNFTVEQYQNNFSGNTEEIKKQIESSLITEEKLKEQRTEAIHTIYSNIEKSTVPNITINMMNPAAAITNNINTTTQNFFQSITNFFNSMFGNNIPVQNPNVPTTLQPEIFSIETTLGITDSNIENINRLYRIFKYGSDILLFSCIALLTIGYIATIPNTKYAINELKAALKSLIIAVVTWVLIPYLFKLFDPELIKVSDTSVNFDVNGIISNFIFEIAKLSIIIPLGYFFITVLVWALLKLYKKSTIANQGFGRYEEDIQEEVPDSESAQDNNESSEKEDNSEE